MMIWALSIQSNTTFLFVDQQSWQFYSYYIGGEVVPSAILLVIQHVKSTEDVNSEVSTLWETIPINQAPTSARRHPAK